MLGFLLSKVKVNCLIDVIVVIFIGKYKFLQFWLVILLLNFNFVNMILSNENIVDLLRIIYKI